MAQGLLLTYQLIGLISNLTYSLRLEQTCFAIHLFILFLGLEEYIYTR